MNIPWTLGAYEIGLVFATVLYGIVVAQTFTYTQEKFMDPIWLRALVRPFLFVKQTIRHKRLSFLGWDRVVSQLGFAPQLNVPHQLQPLRHRSYLLNLVAFVLLVGQQLRKWSWFTENPLDVCNGLCILADYRCNCSSELQAIQWPDALFSERKNSHSSLTECFCSSRNHTCL